jgi:hypothetical protein
LYLRKTGKEALVCVLCVGWAIAAEEREWKYRLSIYYTKPQDSGVFTCSTPRGLTNSITVHVMGESQRYPGFQLFFGI